MASIKVFISSVYKDMESDRQAVHMAIESLELLPNRFEIWPADPSSPKEKCIQEVRDSELFILLLGDTISDITELEFNEAHETIPNRILVFVRRSRRRDKQARKLLKRISTLHSYKQYSSLDELREEVKKGIQSLIFKLLKVDKDDQEGTEEEILIDTEYTLDPRESLTYEFELQEWDYLNGIIDEIDGDPVNVYFLSRDEYVKKKNGKRFRYYGKKKVGAFSFDLDIEEEGTYYLVVENDATKYERELHIKLVRRPF